MNYRIQDAYARAPIVPPPPIRRVYGKNPGQPLAMFETDGTPEQAIDMVKREGFAAAMVVIK